MDLKQMHFPLLTIIYRNEIKELRSTLHIVHGEK